MLHRNRRRAVRGQLDIFSVRFRPYGTDRLGDGLLKGRFFHVQDKCPRLQPGHFDQRLHQKFQFIDLRGHGLQKLRPLFLCEPMLPKDVGKHLDIGNGGLHLMGNVADQLLDGLLIPLALHLALVHDVIVLQELSLYPGCHAVLIRPLHLRLPPGDQGVQRIAYFVCKMENLSLPNPYPQPGQCKNAPCHGQQAVTDTGTGYICPQQPAQQGKKRPCRQNHQNFQSFPGLLHCLPPVQIYPIPRMVLI